MLSTHTQIVAFRCGKISGIRWVRGYVLTIDSTTEKITAVEPPPGWPDRDLRRDGVFLDSRRIPRVGDAAPKGWEKWRS